MTSTRTVFCVSDHTGTTAEAFAHSMMTRFEDVDAAYRIRPFTDTAEKVREVVAEIQDVAFTTGDRPIVFSTLTDASLWGILAEADALVFELFDEFVGRLSYELGSLPSSTVGRYRSMVDAASYQMRLDAMDFALMTDDGLGTKHYSRADVIMVGVSRVGKTPTCIYLSMHYGIRAGNYPLTPEDLATRSLPAALRDHQDKLYGMTIDPMRLHEIRKKRRPDSDYSSLERCRHEVDTAQALLADLGVPIIDTTTRSIEEITATVISQAGLPRRLD